MTEIKIYVRKLYADEGKFGMEYKIQATDGNYYQSRKPFPAGLQEGSDVLLEAEPTKHPKYWKIKQVKAFNADANPLTQDGGGGAGTSPRQSQAPLPPPIPRLTPALQAEWIKKADEALEKAGADRDVEAILEVELVRQYHSEWMSDRISDEKQRNMDRVSKERKGN